MKALAGLTIALVFGVAAAATAAVPQRLVVRTSTHATATAPKPCEGDVQIDKIAVNGRSLLFGEQGTESARMYGHGAVVELYHHSGGRARLSVAAVRRVVVVVHFHCDN